MDTDNEKNHIIGYQTDIKDVNIKFIYSIHDRSPWLRMSGVWGDIENSKTIDGSATFSESHYWAQLGISRTKTDIKRGLVDSVDDITSVYSVVGYELDNLKIYTGLKPKVLDGSVNLKIPSSVNSEGDLLYQNHNVVIRPKSGVFYGLEHNANLSYSNSDQSLKTQLLFDNMNTHQININYQWRF